MKRTFLIFALGAACYAAPDSPIAGYHIVKKISVPGNGGFDYLTADEAGRKLYVSHGTQVDVIDIDSGALAGTISGTEGVHGIAIAPESGHGFTSNGATATATVFDLKTLKPIKEVKTGKKPDAIIYDPSTRRVFAYNGDSDNATVIDAADGKIAGTIELGGAPEFSVADGNGNVFVNLEDKHLTLKLDARKLTVVARWPLAPCEAPSAMAMDKGNNRLFIGCRNHLMAVVDANDGKVITTAPIGDHVDAAAYDMDRKLVFLSCGDGTLWVFHQDSPGKYTHLQTVKTQPSAKTLALDPKTHQIFLSAAEYGAKPEKGRAPIKPGSFTVLVVGN